MTIETQSVTSLLARLIRAIIDKPSFLTLTFDELEARTNWFVGVHIDDQGKVIGKGGCHAKAIQFLLARIGLRYGQQYRLEIEEPRNQSRSSDNPPRRANNYDVREAVELLNDILAEIVGGGNYFAVDASDDHKDREGRTVYVFRIKAANAEAHAAITMQCDPIGRGQAQTVEGALGTLFRAFGLVEGVSFIVEVTQ